MKKYGQEGSYAPNYTSPAETLSKSVPLIEEITVTFHGGIELKNVAVDQIGIGRVFEPGIGIVQLPFLKASSGVFEASSADGLPPMRKETFMCVPPGQIKW